MSSKKRRLARAATADTGEHESKSDTSVYVPQDTVLKSPLEIRCRYRLTERQQTILDTAVDKASKVVFIDGYWGTGKSALAVLAALQLMNAKKASGIVYLRQPLEASNTAKVGTLPGDLQTRMEAYNVILYDKLNEFLPKADIDRLKKEERLECLPVGLIQGKTFARKVVIVDEAASLSYEDLLLVTSRIGEHSKLFIIGDSTFQLSIGAKSGFKRFYDIFADQESMENGLFTFELKRQEDILRSGLLRFVMQKCGVIRPDLPQPKEREPMFPPR